jgi:hypothetical protein
MYVYLALYCALRNVVVRTAAARVIKPQPVADFRTSFIYGSLNPPLNMYLGIQLLTLLFPHIINLR